MADASLVKRLQRGNDRHEQRTRDIPFQTAAAAGDILLKGNQILVILDHINGVVLLKDVMNVKQRGKLAQLR